MQRCAATLVDGGTSSQRGDRDSSMLCSSALPPDCMLLNPSPVLTASKCLFPTPVVQRPAAEGDAGRHPRPPGPPARRTKRLPPRAGPGCWGRYCRQPRCTWTGGPARRRSPAGPTSHGCSPRPGSAGTQRCACDCTQRRRRPSPASRLAATTCSCWSRRAAAAGWPSKQCSTGPSQPAACGVAQPADSGCSGGLWSGRWPVCPSAATLACWRRSCFPAPGCEQPYPSGALAGRSGTQLARCHGWRGGCACRWCVLVPGCCSSWRQLSRLLGDARRRTA